MSNNNNGTGNFLTGVLLGSLVGAATALLLAPKSGKELRTDLCDQMDAFVDKSDGWKDTVMEKGTEFTATAKEKTNQFRQVAMEKGSNIAETVKEKANQYRQSVQNQITETTDDWTESVGEVAEDVAEAAKDQVDEVQLPNKELEDVVEKQDNK